MKKFCIFIAIILFLSSCYNFPILNYALEIEDRGISQTDRTKHIVSITAASDDIIIYYTLNGTSPDSKSKRYSPENYVTCDLKAYDGILVTEGTTIKAVGYKGNNQTFLEELTIPFNEWEIEIIDNGPADFDDDFHIISITDSLWKGEIYFTLDNSNPKKEALTYYPETIQGADGETYNGILVSKGTSVNAVSLVTAGGKERFSSVATALIDDIKWSISIVDNGVSETDKTKHIISITGSPDNEEIHYSTDGTIPSSTSTKYIPADFKGNSGVIYNGILIDEGVLIKAASFENQKRTSSVASKITPWQICITDNGQYIDDGSKHVVSIIDTVKNGTIYYTTDGTVPTSSSNQYVPSKYKTVNGREYEGILVEENSVVKSISFATIGTVSAESSTKEKSVDVYCWEIEILDNGPYANDETKHIITINDTEKDGVIYYSTESSPDSSSTKYDPQSYTGSDGYAYKGILVNELDTIRAISYKNEGESLIISSISLKTISMLPWTINIVDNGQYYEDGTKHIVSITDKAKKGTIYYTTDSSSPTASSTEYLPTKYKSVEGNEYEGILLNEGVEIKAVSHVTIGDQTGISEIAIKKIGVFLWSIQIIDNGSSYEDITKHIITINDTEKNGVIFYSTASSPDSGSTKYNPQTYTGTDGDTYKGILVNELDTVNAISYKTEDGFVKTSDVESTTIGITPWTISIKDYGQYFEDTSKHVITISDSIRNGVIRYTTGNEVTTLSSEEYTTSKYKCVDGVEREGILISEGITIKAVSYIKVNDVTGTSCVSTHTVEKYQWKLTIKDNGTSSTDITKHIISIEDSEKNGDIYYTTGTSIPNSNSTRYVPQTYEGSDGNSYKGILASELESVNAISYKTENEHLRASEVASLKVEIAQWPIEIVDYGQSFYDGSKHIIAITDTKRSGIIYYTINGDSPTENSILYSSEKYKTIDNSEYDGILVEEGVNIKAVSILTIGEDRECSSIARQNVSVLQWSISIVDNGVYINDKSKHIISITDSLHGGDIYYDTAGATPNSKSTKYSPSDYTGTDSKTYNGLLMSAGDRINAISYYGKSSSAISHLEIVYSIGETGPSGGYIFYDKGSYSDGWRYLEAAPSDLNGSYAFGYTSDNSIVGTEDEIGKGMTNTTSLANAVYDAYGNKIVNAAVACLNYSITVNGTIFDDWFLPSKEELNLLYENLHKNNIGNFNGRYYWSSSEENGSYAWRQLFDNGGQNYETRANTFYSLYVRPVRAL